MGLLTVHTTPLVREYQSGIISRASLFSCICILLCVICPFLIAYGSHGFWAKHQVQRERPSVRFKHQLLLLIQTQTSDNLITWSTFPEYNSLMHNYLRHPRITVSVHGID